VRNVRIKLNVRIEQTEAACPGFRDKHCGALIFAMLSNGAMSTL
jgi:hypothetical protein